jgi:cytochrome P450
MPPEFPPQLPLELDPPVHAAYRKPLTFALLPRTVAALEDKVRQTTVALIEGFQSHGKCEFIGEFAKVLPIVVFLDLVDLPREDRHTLLPITEDSVRGATVEVRGAAHRAVAAYLQKYIAVRREKPGTDLLSTIVNTEVDGQRISLEEATSFASLVLFGGLDTVAGMLGFIARFLAMHPEHRDDIAAHLDDESFLRNAVEELVRVHGLANTARIATRDFTYKDIAFRAGDTILPANLFVGLDDRRVSDPLTVNFRRPAPAPHATFGNGPHICPGAILARREIKIFLQEWLKRIPVFGIEPGTKPVLVTGMVNGVLELKLEWP